MKKIHMMAACLLLMLPLFSASVFAINVTYATIVNQTGSTTQLLYDNSTTSYVDAGVNHNAYLILCTNDSADLENKYLGYAYHAGDKYVQLNSFIGDPLGNMLPVLSVNASNCTRVDLDFSSTKAYYPGVPSIVISNDNMIDINDTFYKPDISLAFLNGSYDIVKTDLGTTVSIGISNMVDSYGNPITILERAIVISIFREDTNETLDSAIIMPNETIILSKLGYSGSVVVGLDGVSVPKSDGESCTSPGDCLGGYCVHGFCRSSEIFCGEDFCDSGEACGNCPTDCGSCLLESELPPPVPTEEQPTVAPLGPPAAPEIWPQEVSMPLPGQTITIPQTGMTILLTGMLINNTPTNGTIAILIYPKTNNTAVIHNISAIDPQKLMCGQTALTSHEINITADVINYCMNYKGKLGDIREKSVTVWRFFEGRWSLLPPDYVMHDTDIICGNITSAMTPYMIAGFTPIVGITPELALSAIQTASAEIAKAHIEGKDITRAQDLLNQAIEAFNNCDFSRANDLAGQASFLTVGLSPTAIMAITLVLIGLIGGYYSFIRLKKMVKPAVKTVPRKTESVKEMPKAVISKKPTVHSIRKPSGSHFRHMRKKLSHKIKK